MLIAACSDKTPPPDAVVSAASGTEGTVAAGPPPSVELRAQLRELAVAAECLRRSDAPNEEVSKAMMALYAKHGVELDTYAREMGRLGGDAGFQAEIQAGLASCPTPPVAVGDAATPEPSSDGDTAGAEPVGAGTVEGNAGAAEDVAVGPGAGEGGPDSPDAAGAAAEPGAATPEEPVAADVVPGDELPEAPGVEDPVAAADPDVAEPPAPPVPDGPDFTGTWTGALRGTASGTLRLVVDGTSLDSVSLNIGGRSVRLQGTLTASGKLALGGRLKASEFIRMRGTASRDGTRITGSWDGVMDRKMAKGSFSLTR